MLKRSREEAGLAGRIWELIQISEALPRGADQSPPDTQQPHQQQPDKPAEVTQQHAVRYLAQMKQRFAGHPDKVYETFLDTLRQFRQGCLDADGVAARVRMLLVGHDDLLAGFSRFLSTDSGIPLGPLSPKGMPAAAGMARVRME